MGGIPRSTSLPTSPLAVETVMPSDRDTSLDVIPGWRRRRYSARNPHPQAYSTASSSGVVRSRNLADGAMGSAPQSNLNIPVLLAGVVRGLGIGRGAVENLAGLHIKGRPVPGTFYALTLHQLPLCERTANV